MQNNLFLLPTAEPRRCAECGENSARVGFQNEQFPYGTGPDQVTLTARVPVWKCAACGAEYTDADAEDLRHAEVCRFLGRLSPAEIRGIRETYRLSQHEWSAVTGFGLASIKRWEVGNLIQNEAADRYIRLLESPTIFAKVAMMSERPVSRLDGHRFRTAPSNDARARAAVFVLRKSYG